MKLILITFTTLIWNSYAAPEGSPNFNNPAPVYKAPESFVADQPQFIAETKAVNVVPVSTTAVQTGSSDNAYVYNHDGFAENTNMYQAYDQGYGVQSGYEGYLVPTGGYYSPAATEVGPVAYALSFIPATLLAVLGKGLTFLASAAAVVLLGAVLVFGVCTFTPICHIKLSGFNPITIKEEVRSYMTPDNISAGVNFLREAINKYQKMQK